MAVGAGGFSGDAGAAGGGAAGQPQHVGIYAPGSCSETNLRTGPPAGKAMFKTDPIDNKFPFAEHWVGEWIGGTDANHIGGQTLADLDGDGDLDFAAGQRSILPGGMIWWEQCTADHWVGHRVGTGQQTQASGDALDVDGDGLLDLLSGDSWFKNPGRSREMEWPRFNAHTPVAEELTVGDVTGDGKAEIMYAANGFNAQWWSPGPNPEGGFVKGGELGQSLQQGVAWGDLNGDGANDY
ncbi:MAG TPA: VCBS repeat-containing protein, partial [Lacunisphaera sp.]|nr:VCBS repeat-containing protein [Lacunisphaera sp.]